MQRLSLPAQPCTSSAALPRARWAAARPAPSSSWRAPAGRRRQRAAPPQAAQQQQEQPPQQPQQQQQPEQLPEPPSGFPGGSGLPVAASLVAAAALLTAVGSPVAGQALAMEVHAEPANALSLPTWMVHVSSVVEWTIAMGLM